MALAYKRLTEEQDKLGNVFPKGEYPFSVKSVQQKPTKSGLNNMLVVELSVMNDKGKSKLVTDFIMLDMDDMAWKLRHFAASCGLLDYYDNDTLESTHFLGKHGVVKLAISDYEKDGEMLKSNKVTDYVKPGQAKGNQQINDAEPFYNDDIPL